MKNNMQQGLSQAGRCLSLPAQACIIHGEEKADREDCHVHSHAGQRLTSANGPPWMLSQLCAADGDCTNGPGSRIAAQTIAAVIQAHKEDLQ